MTTFISRRFLVAALCSMVLADSIPVLGSMEVDQTIQQAKCVEPSTNASLRSAYLVRRLGNASSGAQTLAERNAVLRRHFEAVINILIRQRDSSIDAALERLEQYRSESWSEEQRFEWRSRLEHERWLQIVRLLQYRNGGRFPQNRVSVTSVPVFVDDQGTACAVGHLMRRSGWKREVASIVASNNNVYVPDVSEGPLLRWVMTSGLLLEEAAMIQPTYDPPPFDHSLTELTGGSEIVRDGLRFHGFELSIEGTAINQPNESGLGVTYYRWPNQVLEGTTEGIWFGASRLAGLGWTTAEERLSVQFEYDVTLDGDSMIDRYAIVTSNSPFGGWWGSNFAEGSISLETTVSSRNHELGQLSMAVEDGTGFELSDAQVLSFAPVNTLHIATRMSMEGAGTMTAFLQEFHVIPELLCDLNEDGGCDVDDVDRLFESFRHRDQMFDINQDGRYTFDDLESYIHDLRNTWFGDANLDGRFNSADLVTAFVAGKYDRVAAAGWSEGDWNGDRFFDSEDLVHAFQDGGYEAGRREAVLAVPEPAGQLLLLVGMLGLRYLQPRRYRPTSKRY